MGSEAQQAALSQHAEAEGYTLIQTFEKIETRKGSDTLDRRLRLLAALRAARRRKAPIVAAKLDRLGCDVHFIGSMTHQTPFIVAELGANSDPSMLNLGAALAEKWATISRRTKDAFEAQGVKLGVLNAKGIQNRDEAMALARSCPILHGLRAYVQGHRGVPTQNSGKWDAATVAPVTGRLLGFYQTFNVEGRGSTWKLSSSFWPLLLFCCLPLL